MRTIINCICFAVSILSTVDLLAQMPMDEIDRRLKNRAFFQLDFDKNLNVVLPDSIQVLFAKALNGEIPEAALDSMVNYTPQQEEQIKSNIKNQFRGDSIDIQKEYMEHLENTKKKYREMYAKRSVPRELILTAGNWKINEAIPILKKAIEDERYDQTAVLMALAKLGNDSIRQVLVDRYTLEYFLTKNIADTLNNRFIDWEKMQPFLSDGIATAFYLKNNEILLNLQDLIYIRGRTDYGFGVNHVFDGILIQYCFSEMAVCPNFFESYAPIYWDYHDTIKHFEDKKILNEREKQELERLLSTEYRTKIRDQLRAWIIENVNFN